MKKFLIMAALGAMAFAVRAEGIVNGDFSWNSTNKLATSAVAGNPMSDVYNMGWYTNDPTAQNIQITGGEAVRTTVGPGSPGTIAQFFTSTNNGPTTLNFDIKVTDADADVVCQVILFGYTLTTANHIIGSGDAARLLMNNTTLPANGANYNVTQLVKYDYAGGTLNGGVYKTISTNFTASTSYEFYGIRMQATHPDAADDIRFDNVMIGAGSGPAPKPATMFFIK